MEAHEVGGTFAELLASARADAGLTQEELAERAQLSARALSSLERGEAVRPRRATVDRLIAGLGLTGGEAARFAALARGQRLGAESGPAELPTDLPDFTGRADELARLTGLLASGRGVRLVVLGGGGGVGKSALAVHAAHLLRDRYPDGQLYLDLAGSRDDPVEPSAALAGFLTALGAEAGQRGEDLARRTARYRSVLAGLRVLVLLDDAADATQVRPLLPTGPGSAVVVTSRHGLADLAGATHLTVDRMEDREATDLFVRLVGAERVAVEAEAVARVIAACERLPLAVRIAGARLAVRPQWTIGALADRLAATRGRLDELSVGDLAVRASFRLSHDRLTLQLATLFTLLAHWPGHDISVPVAAALAGLPAETTERCLEQLVDRYLLESPAPGRYRQHDLLHAFAAELLAEIPPEQSGEALRRLVRYVTAVAHQADRALWPTSEPPFAVEPEAPEFTGYRAALSWYASQWPALMALLRRIGSDAAVPADAAARLAALLSLYPFVRGDYPQLERSARQAAELADRAGDDKLAATAHKRLGIALLEQHRADEAAEHHEKALVRFRAAGARDGEATILNSIGRRLMHERRYPEARRYLLESLAVGEEADAVSAQATALCNLGVLEHRVGDDAAALGYLERALGLCAEPVSQMAVAVSSNMGSALAGLGRPVDAIRSHERARSICRELGDPRGESSALSEQSETYLVLGRADRAVACARQALALRQQERMGRLAEAEVRVVLGRALRALGQNGEARVHWRWALPVLVESDAAAADSVRELLGQ